MQKISSGKAGENFLEGGRKRDFCRKSVSYFFSSTMPPYIDTNENTWVLGQHWNKFWVILGFKPKHWVKAPNFWEIL